MPINTGDIKLLESDTMSDADEGGGAMTGVVIVDGESNNIFEDISTLDRVYGAVHMRKIFPSIQIQTQDKYFGSHVIISKLPTDEKIGVNLFDTGDWFDRRPEAQSRVENYRARAGIYSGALWSTQWEASKTITIFQDITAPIPKTGDVLHLTQLSDTQFQYVKIVDVSASEQSFNDPDGPYTKNIVTIQISQGLDFDFVGSPISRIQPTGGAEISNTLVANAAKYFSARPLALVGAPDDVSVKVDTVYSQIIPSSLQEDALLDVSPTIDEYQLFDSSYANETIVFSADFGPNVVVHLQNAFQPGSVSIVVSGGTITDEGGKLLLNSVEIGDANYVLGTFTFKSDAPILSGSKTINFLPTTAPNTKLYAGVLSVNDDNRGYIWNMTLSPKPAPGSVRVQYMALGNWYELRDNASGGLSGLEGGIGSGVINYATGTVSITTTALPDAETEIIFSWGVGGNFTNLSSAIPFETIYNAFVANAGVSPATVALSWIDGVAKTAVSDAAGDITGDITGTINQSGEIVLDLLTLPDPATLFTLDYEFGLDHVYAATVVSVGGLGELVTIDLGATNLIPNSVRINYGLSLVGVVSNMHLSRSRYLLGVPIVIVDDGIGGLEFNGVPVPSGTINYATGVLSFDPRRTVSYKHSTYNSVYAGIRCWPWLGSCRPYYSWVLASVDNATAQARFQESTIVTVFYRDSATLTVAQNTFNIDQLTFQIPDDVSREVAPLINGSLRMVLGANTYSDADGSIFHSESAVSGVGTFAGTVNYAARKIAIDDWEIGANNAVDMRSLADTFESSEPVDTISFVVPNPPIKSLSLQIRATRISDGVDITATSDSEGRIQAAGIEGDINYQTGITHIRFGDTILAAGNEGEEWYSAEAIDEDGNIFRPESVATESLLFNATSQTFLPLDSEILGLNPVRLPQDGRIPIYADGDVVVILHDQITVGTYSNAEVTNLGRGRIAKLSVRDSAGAEILASTYTADLDAGTITWVDLSGIAQPLTITDRIEDMSVLTDVQITGKLSLSQPLTHNFPLDGTLVSNAVIYGDLYAHTSIPFDQQTWTGEWSDVLIGSEVVAEYNNSVYPIAVDNANCIQERWQIYFASSTTVNVIGENVGQILTGVLISANISPINPNTGQAYFTIPAAGWGSGWSAGNVLRFNTLAANAPLWIIQSVGQGEATDTDYNFCVEVRGDIDTP